MARDGSGNYSLPSGNPVVNGTNVSSTVHNTTMTDVATALTASIAKDGQTAATANLPMGTFAHTNVGDSTARNMYGATGQIQDNDFNVLGSVSGTNTIVGSLTPAITGYSAGMHVTFVPANTNTGAATLAVNGLTALDIQKGSGAALAPGDLVTGIPALLVLDGGGDDWILMNPQLSVVGLSGSFTVTLTGVVGTVTQTMHYVRVGDQVTLFFASGDVLNGTSNSAFMTVTGKPAALRPSGSRTVVTVADDNSATFQAAAALVRSSNDTIDFYVGVVSGTRMTYNVAGWTSSGTKGLGAGWTITYQL